MPLILIGVLRGYINNPARFVIASKITFRKFRKRIELDLPEDFIETAGFMAWIYIRLKKKTDKERAFEIIRAAVLTSGLAVQQANFRNVEEGRTMENLVKYQQITNREGPTRLNTMEVIEESGKRYAFRVTRCLFHELFSQLGVPELTSIMCSIDNAIFNTYLPEKLTFHRNGLHNTIADGKEFCDFVIENNKVS